MDLENFVDAVQCLSDVKSIEEIEAFCHRLGRQFEFDHFIYALSIPTRFSESRLIMVNGYPDNWVEHYFRHAYYDVDPVIHHCVHHIAPLQWHALSLDDASPAARMMNDACEFGLKSGITVPVHGPHGELGILSFASDRASASSRARLIHALPYFQLLAPYVYEALRRIASPGQNHATPPLSGRETDCLRWAADGKTAWEIGQVLSLSERTINFHLNNAVRKLGVCSRQHAVAKAVLQGALRPQPF